MSADTSQQDAKLQAELLSIIPFKPRATKISKVVNWLLIFVVLVALPVAYYFGYIGKEWINRIGIILNFCAGFMVAPELIGQDRLRKVEENLERFVSLTYTKTKEARSALGKLEDIEIWALSGAFVIILLVLIDETYNLGIKYIATLLYVILAILSALLFMFLVFYIAYIALVFVFIKKRRKEIISRIKNNTKGMTFGSPIRRALIPASFKLTSITFLFLINKFLAYLVQTLSTDNSLRLILIYWGIIFFILGNLLQFLSTF